MSTPDDPERLAEGTASSPLGALFASAARDLPSDEQLARLAAQLGPVLDSAPQAPSAPSAPAGTSLRVVLGVAAGTLLLVVGAGLALRRPAPTPAALPSAAPKVAEIAPTAQPQAPVPAPEPAPAPEARGTSESPDKPSAPSSKSPATQSKPSEAALLEQARRALNTSPSYALQLANQHRALFPHGVLTQEREVIAIEALRRLHRGTEADQRATGFSKAFPGSAHQRMVDEVAPK